MPRFYPVETELDGRPVRGEWTLLQGGRICVRSAAYGARTLDLGAARPEVVAARELAKLVAAWRRAQAQERQRVERETLRVAHSGRASRRRAPPKAAEP